MKYIPANIFNNLDEKQITFTLCFYLNHKTHWWITPMKICAPVQHLTHLCRTSTYAIIRNYCHTNILISSTTTNLHFHEKVEVMTWHLINTRWIFTKHPTIWNSWIINTPNLAQHGRLSDVVSDMLLSLAFCAGSVAIICLTTGQ